MAWIESHQALGHHPKTLLLADALGCSLPTAIGHLQFLWWWALDYAQDGWLKPGSQRTIARACEWRGQPDRFFHGLVSSGFVDVEAEGGRIHDWQDYAGKLLDKREDNRARMRARRDARVQHTTSAQPPDVQDTTSTRPGATVPNLTVPNRPDQPDQTGPDQPIPPNPPSDPPKGGEESETCPECGLPVSRDGTGHGLSSLPGRLRNCSLYHLAPHDWHVGVEVMA